MILSLLIRCLLIKISLHCLRIVFVFFRNSFRDFSSVRNYRAVNSPLSRLCFCNLQRMDAGFQAFEYNTASASRFPFTDITVFIRYTRFNLCRLIRTDKQFYLFSVES